MARTNAPLLVFNRGRISRLGLGRVDLDRTRLSAEVQTNFVPRTLGSMSLRPGFEYIGTIRNSSTAILIPFVKRTDDTALIELTSTAMRVWANSTVAAGIAPVERAGSTSVISLGTFSSTLLGGWTDADESGATSEYFGSTIINADSSDFMSLVGTRFSRAIRRQTVTSSSGTFGLTCVIERGRVNLRVGSSAGGDDYFAEASLRPGVYSLSITSTGDFDIEFSANTYYRSLVNSVTVESSGDMVIASTWPSSDLSHLRWDQSADVIFVAGSTRQQKRIERYSTDSWALVQYEPEDGPFRVINITNKRLTGSTLTGNITLACDKPLFRSGHEGALFRLTSAGQSVTVTITGENQFSNAIRVSGARSETDVLRRAINILVQSSTDFVATLNLQRSIGELGNFTNVTDVVEINSTFDSAYVDNLDNQIIFYRIGVETGKFTSGTLDASLSFSQGGLNGIVRIDSVFSATESSASVLFDLGSTESTELWEEGDWSNVRGWPTAVGFHEGRLWFAGKAKIWGSISDAFESFDPAKEGDAGPINRSIASGPVDTVQWLVSVGRLIIGSEGEELQARTGALDEPLTPSNFNLKDISTLGSANVQAVKIDQRLLFVEKAGVRVMETGRAGDTLDYATADRTVLIPEIGEPGIIRMGVQRQPDTRVHAVHGCGKGTVALLVSDPAEDVAAWIDIESSGGVNGQIEEVAILPSTSEDAVYYIVQREIDGSTKRYLERWATELENCGGCRSASLCFEVTTDVSSITVDGTEILSSAVTCGATDVFLAGETTAPSCAELVEVTIEGGDIDVEVSEGWDVTTLSLDFQLVFDSPQDIENLRSLEFTPDGTKVYIVSLSGVRIFEYDLSPAYELRNPTFVASFVPTEETVRIEGFYMSPDGRRMFVLHGLTSRTMFQYNLLVPFSITTASYANKSVDFTGSVGGLQGMHFQKNGRRLWINTGSAAIAKIHEFDLGAAFELDSLVNNNVSLDIEGISSDCDGIEFKADGRKLYYISDNDNLIYQLDVAIPFSLASASTVVDASGTVAFNDPQALAWRPDGLVLWIGKSDTKEIYQYFLTATTASTTITLPGSDFGATVFEDTDTLCIDAPVGSSANGLEVIVDSTRLGVLTGGQIKRGPGCQPCALNKIADSFLTQSGTATNIFSGLDHLVGSSVIVWGAGRDLGSYTVSSSGTVTMIVHTTEAIAGLPFSSIYMSAKLAYGAEAGTALTQRKKVNHIGLVADCLHARGLEYGPSTSRLDPMPQIEGGAVISTDLVHDVYDEVSFEFDGTWDSDSRIVLRGIAPRPATILGVVVQMDTKEKT